MIKLKMKKLQYNINREAAKISAVSSDKIKKYEYLTGEKILPSNQKQVIEQAKFTYSPLGKVFKKQIKTIEDQVEKQIKIIQNQGKIESIKKYAYNDKNKLAYETFEEITKLDKKVNPDDLIYRHEGSTAYERFNKFDNALHLIDKIREGEISLTDAKNGQAGFKSHLSEIIIIIKKRNKKTQIKRAKKHIA